MSKLNLKFPVVLMSFDQNGSIESYDDKLYLSKITKLAFDRKTLINCIVLTSEGDLLRITNVKLLKKIGAFYSNFFNPIYEVSYSFEEKVMSFNDLKEKATYTLIENLELLDMPFFLDKDEIRSEISKSLNTKELFDILYKYSIK